MGASFWHTLLRRPKRHEFDDAILGRPLVSPLSTIPALLDTSERTARISDIPLSKKETHMTA
jgi:hypothetical protein